MKIFWRAKPNNFSGAPSRWDFALIVGSFFVYPGNSSIIRPATFLGFVFLILIIYLFSDEGRFFLIFSRMIAVSPGKFLLLLRNFVT
jgi:hypothetical protein